jgi:S1-C subfamily serine protease
MLEPADTFAVANGALMIVVGDPASSAGIQTGDIVTAVDAVPVGATATLEQVLDSFAPGQTVRVSIDRAGSNITLRVTLASE